MSFQDDGYRTGFPKTCPTGRVKRVVAADCLGCKNHIRDARGHWRCDHSEYQNAPGSHFCGGCGIELGPYAEANGWEHCGGPVELCRYDVLHPGCP